MRTAPGCNLLAICCGHWRRGGQQAAAFRQCLRTEAIGKKAEVTNADEALRQHMQKESSQELSRGERHNFLCTAVRVVLPLKADSLSVEGNQTVIGNRDAMRIAAEIAQHLHGSAKGGFGVNHPAPQMEAAEQFGKLFGSGKQMRRAGAAELAALTQPLQACNELGTKNFAQGRDRQ